MRRLALFCLPFLAASCQAQPLTQGDRDFTVSALHASRKLFIDTISGLSQAQLNWKPAPDRWSVLETAEHIVLSEDFIPQLAQKSLQSPATPEKRKPNAREIDAKVLAGVADRTQKAKAPEPLTPAHKFKDAAQLIAAFKAARDKNIAYIRTTQDDLRSHFTPSAGFGELDALQWYTLTAGHADRHVAQIKEVMATPGFPKK